MRTKISVITPFYNSFPLFRESLTSLSYQKESSYELILINDGSSHVQHATLKSELKRIQQATLIESVTQAGPSAARNRGLEKSFGEYVLFLDSDDILEPFCLEKRLTCMDKYPEKDIWVFPIGQMNEKGERQTLFYSLPKPTREENIIEFLRGNYPWQTMGALWRKETLQKLDGFNESMRYFEDPELALRALFDVDIEFHFECDGSPDCYYRVYDDYKVTALEPKKLNKFTDDKIIFFKSAFHLITKRRSNEYLPFLTEGIKSFLQGFALAQSKLIHNQIIELIQWSYQNHLISKSYFWFVKIQAWLWFRNKHPIVKKSRIIGLLARIRT
ncbi:MAG: glycosyltransferase family 2 protein [Cyclobacteriaceae bacterium]